MYIIITIIMMMHLVYSFDKYNMRGKIMYVYNIIFYDKNTVIIYYLFLFCIILWSTIHLQLQHRDNENITVV